MNYVVDTNIINRLVDGTIQPEDLPNDGQFIATHVQIDELNKTPDQERRARLFIKFATTVDDVVPTESLVVGISRIGLSKVSDGKTYSSLRTALDARNKGKPNNGQDSLIAEVAIKRGCVLLTADSDLAEVVENHGCKVLHFAP
jgi:predicted nucleic acid-binding protein